jgi:YD repeat-containing protein
MAEITEERPDSVVVRSYTYDSRHRLTGEKSAGGTAEYVPSRIQPVFDDGFLLHAPKSLELNGQSYPFTYDENGNMVAMPDLSDPLNVRERLIAYNAENMPV